MSCARPRGPQAQPHRSSSFHHLPRCSSSSFSGQYGVQRNRGQLSRTKRSADFIALLEEVDRRYGPKLGVALKPIVLVLDNGPIHTSKMSRAALAERAHWLTVEWLPKYAPALNDIEVLWRDLKRHHLAHQTFTGPDDLECAIQEAVTTLNTERSRHPWDNQQIAA